MFDFGCQKVQGGVGKGRIMNKFSKNFLRMAEEVIVKWPSWSVKHEKSVLGAFAKLQKATINFVMSVRLSAWSNSTATGRIFMKFYTNFFENLSRKFKFR